MQGKPDCHEISQTSLDLMGCLRPSHRSHDLLHLALVAKRACLDSPYKHPPWQLEPRTCACIPSSPDDHSSVNRRH